MCSYWKHYFLKCTPYLKGLREANPTESRKVVFSSRKPSWKMAIVMFQQHMMRWIEHGDEWGTRDLFRQMIGYLTDIVLQWSAIQSCAEINRPRTSRFEVVRPLRKHAYSNILKILQSKKENFQIKKSDIFQIPAQNIDWGCSTSTTSTDKTSLGSWKCVLVMGSSSHWG